MPDSVVEEIKRKIDIVELIGSYVKLQKAGVNYRCPSPFNAEKNPSFFVSPAKQIWHDFSANRGGDAFKFVMEIEGVDFPQALRILAKRVGVKLPENPEWKKSNDEKEKLLEACDLASKFFEAYLEKSKTGLEAKQYLLDRGLDEETIKNWRLGYAPDKWHALIDFLQTKKFTRNEIERAGLAIRKTEGNFYDRFKMRIMFPLFDQSGQIVGFTGRVLHKEQELQGMAKYMNIPNTLIYDKSRLLYGLHRAKTAIVKNDACILVEGQMDCLMSHQAGIENTVAVSGTALTPFHLGILKRYSKNLVIAFDMDLGGNNATERGIKMALGEGFNVKTVVIHGGKDPADIVQADPQQWRELVSNTKSILDYYFDIAFSRHDKNSIDGKKAISAMVLPVVKRISNRIEQVFWLGKLSANLGIREEALSVEMEKIPENEEYGRAYQQMSAQKQKIEIQSKTRKDKLEERIFSLVLTKPDLKDRIQDEDTKYFSPKLALVWEGILTNGLQALQSQDYEMQTYLKDLIFQYEILGRSADDFTPAQELDICLKEYRLINLKEKMSEVSLAIKQAEAESDSQRLTELCSEFKDLGNKINKLV